MALTKIRYKGLSDERIMTKKELGDAGYPVDNGFKWDRSNRWSQYMEDPTDDFLQMLKDDGNFIVEDASEEGDVPKVIVKNDPDKADDTGATVVDNNQAKAVENKTAGKGK